MRFAVYGASGRTGRAFCKLALDHGHHVLAILRNPDQLPEFKKLGAHTALLDIASATVEELSHAMTSYRVDTVIWAAGTAENRLARTIDYQAQVNIYDAMESTGGGSRRYLAVSSIGVWKKGAEPPAWMDEHDREVIARFREILGDVVDAKYDAEVELHKRKSIAWTVIRPGGLSDAKAGGAQIGQLGTKRTSRELVAQVLLASVDRQGMHGRTVDVLDGEGTVDEEIKAVIKGNVDSWVGPG